MKRQTSPIWTPLTWGINGKLAKRATKNIRTNLTEIAVRANRRQKRRSQPLLGSRYFVERQLWLIKRQTSPIWTPITWGTVGKLVKRATKNIRAVSTEIGAVTNGGQNPHVSTLNWIKGLLLSVYSSHNGWYAIS